MGRKPKNSPLDKATDLTSGGATADLVVPVQKEGDPLGQTKDLQTQVDSVGSPMNPPQETTGVASQAIPSPINLGAGTNRMLEPQTTGVPIGSGSNGPMSMPTNTLQNFLVNAKRMTQDPIFDELLSEDFLEEEVNDTNAQSFLGL